MDVPMGVSLPVEPDWEWYYRSREERTHCWFHQQAEREYQTGVQQQIDTLVRQEYDLVFQGAIRKVAEQYPGLGLFFI